MVSQLVYLLSSHFCHCVPAGIDHQLDQKVSCSQYFVVMGLLPSFALAYWCESTEIPENGKNAWSYVRVALSLSTSCAGVAWQSPDFSRRFLGFGLLIVPSKSEKRFRLRGLLFLVFRRSAVDRSVWNHRKYWMLYIISSTAFAASSVIPLCPIDLSLFSTVLSAGYADSSVVVLTENCYHHALSWKWFHSCMHPRYIFLFACSLSVVGWRLQYTW